MSMTFWSLANQYDEEVFYDFSKEEDTMTLSEFCFLPTQKMASDFIENELNDDYVVVKIELYSLDRDGSWAYSRDTVERWDRYQNTNMTEEE